MDIEGTIRQEQFCQIRSEIRGSDDYLVVSIATQSNNLDRAII